MPSLQPPAPSPQSLSDATCLACGCLCDDITLSVINNHIVRAERACPIGERWFLAKRPTDVPVCRIDGRAASMEAGIEQAAGILRGATRPLIFGLAGATCEALRAAMALADRLGACVDAGNEASAALAAAVQSVGMVTATLGEVRHRADLVIFWGADPATTHPRHFERYSLWCPGEFIPRGRADRTLVVIDCASTPTAAAADLFLQIAAGSDSEALATLRSLLAGEDLDAAAIQRTTGVPLAQWQVFSDRLKVARYGALFFDPARVGSERHRALESMLTFVRDMNRHTRFVALPLGAPGNAAGAEQVSTWQTGFPSAVDFAEGFPRHHAVDYQAGACLAGGTADAVLIVAGEFMSTFPETARAHLATVPRVVLQPAGMQPLDGAAVTFAVATPGIDTSGAMFRSDGVALPLRPAIKSPYPNSEAVLHAIEHRVKRGHAS